MRKLFVSLFLLSSVGLVGSTFAQGERPVIKWIDLDRPDSEFSLEVPEGFEFGKPEYADNKIEARGEFHSDAERLYLFIDPSKGSSQRRVVEAWLKHSNQTAANTFLHGRNAKKAEFEDATGFYHRVLFIDTPSRLFTLHTVSRSEITDAALHFLNSLKLTAVPGLETASRTKSFAPLTEDISKAPIKTTDRGSGSGSGVGAGSGSGSGNGTGGVSTPQPPRQIEPLGIRTKPKAAYTDFARFYLVQGTVTLRVTFQSDGKIGSVVKIKSLPFGLTETSVVAARGMTFAPEKVNGVPRTTARPVVYTFNIY